MCPREMPHRSGGPPPLSRPPSTPPPLSCGKQHGNVAPTGCEPTTINTVVPYEERPTWQWHAIVAAGVAVALALGLIVYVSVQTAGVTRALSLAELVKMVEPSVVRIEVPPDFVGTGFLVGNTGTVVTNWHVIEGASEATVTLSDGRVFQISGCLAVEPKADLAFLQLDCPVHLLPRPLKLSPSLPEKGEKVFALGNPLGLSSSVSDGIVAALRNRAEVGGGELIQHTASISKGNSGGPLINSRGEVVGVNTLSLDFLNLGSQNLNFAVSSREVLSLASKPAIPATFPLRAPSND